MSSTQLGKGRGRGLLRFVDAKPDQQDTQEMTASTQSRTPDAMEQLAALVNAMSLEPMDCEILPIQDNMTKAAVDVKSLEACVQLLVTRCENDWHFARSGVNCGVSCCKLDALKSIGGTSFRTIFLKTLQSLYKQKDSLRAKKSSADSSKVNNSRWLSCVALLSQALVQMPLADGSPMKIFVKPVFELLEFCLSADATSEELECAATQILDIGPMLSAHCSGPELKALVNLIRARITNGSGLQETRLMLIEATEGFVSNWQFVRPPPASAAAEAIKPPTVL